MGETMTRSVQAVLAEAPRLDLQARAELAAELLGSIEGPSDPGAGATWPASVRLRRRCF